MTTSSNDPDEIRREIEQTRGSLSRDVNQLGDTVSPGTIAERQKVKMRRQVGGWKERIMGSADDTGGGAEDTANALAQRGSDAKDQASERTHEVVQSARSRTQGNPLAVGLMAVGAGWLLASILPASQSEQQAAQALKDKAQPVLSDAAAEAKQAGQQMADNLKGHAQSSVEEVRSQAQSSAQDVRSQAQSSAGDVRSQAQSSAGDVKDSARQAARDSSS